MAIGAVVCLGSSAYLYTGVLVEYFLDDQGQLNRLVLASAARRPLSDDQASESGADPDQSQAYEERFYPIEGDYFVLRYSEVLTLNVRYLDLSG